MFGQFTGIWPALAVIVTFGISLGHVVFKTGHLTARVEGLEAWRSRVRDDMHEVSDQVQALTAEIRQLHTLIEERTERRVSVREQA